MREGAQALAGGVCFSFILFAAAIIFQWRKIKQCVIDLVAESFQIAPDFIHEGRAFRYDHDRPAEKPFHFNRQQGGGGEGNGLEAAQLFFGKCLLNRRQ